jgi:hypothetical protein
MNSRLPTRLLSLVLIALGATATLHAAQVALIADASVNSMRSSTNFGGLSNLYIGNGSTTFLRFDLGTLPAGTSANQISRATLTVFVNRVNATGPVTLSPVTSGWTESAVTEETIPTIGAPAGTFTASTAGQFITLDVTAIVQGWITTPATDFGFALSSAIANLLLDSKENDETGHATSLDITITSEGATGVQGMQGIDGSVGPAGPQGLAGLPGLLGLPGLIGPQGIQGTVGPAGLPGSLGPQGTQGTAGPVGLPGLIGPQGTQGTAGPVGLPGLIGPQGTQGIAGPVGLPGAIGPEGIQGTEGSVGPIGPIGTTGLPGSIGAAGAIGPIGPAGIQGTAGTTGVAGATGVNGANGATGDIGPTGSDGANGAAGATGTFSAAGNWASDTTYQVGQVVFCAACSSNGSSYIAIANNTNQDPPTQTSVWNLVAQAGAAGTNGINGTNGLPGPTGSAGSPGAAGAPGSPGATGLPGATGATGPEGPAGAQGISGANGAPGTSGANGETGAAGATGAPGPFVGGTYSAAIDYPAGSVVDYASSTYLAVQTNGPSTTTIIPGNDSAYWVATTGSSIGSASPASYIDVSETVASATVAIGAEVFAFTSAPSPLVASNSGFTFNPTTGTVTVAAAGIYTYDYDVSVDEPGVLALTDNGVFIPGTSFGRSTGTTQIIGHGQISLNAGDVVGLISDGSAAALTLYGITTFQNIAAFSLVAVTAGASGATGSQGPQGVPGVNGLTGATGPGTVDSITVGTVTTSGSAGAVSIGGTATTPTININFPAGSGSGGGGFVWTTSFQAPADMGPDTVNPLTGAIALGTQTPQFAFAPMACTAASLQVFAAEVGPQVPPGPILVTAQNNGTNTSMSCSVEPNPPGFFPATSCTSTATFSVNLGDEIQYSIIQPFPPQTGDGAFVQVGATLTCQNQ